MVQDRLGREVARLGGPFAVTADTRLSEFDLPRACCNGAPANGLGLRDLHAGRYRALLYFNGHRQPGLEFRVRALQGRGRIKVVAAHLEDAEGQRRTTWTSKERGVYARVSLVNLTRQVAHEHLVQVAWSGTDGPVARTQGGLLRVAKGELLDGRDFPYACDPQHHDGILIRDTPLGRQPGDYRMRVLIDGEPVVEVPFKLIP